MCEWQQGHSIPLGTSLPTGENSRKHCCGFFRFFCQPNKAGVTSTTDTTSYHPKTYTVCNISNRHPFIRYRGNRSLLFPLLDIRLDAGPDNNHISIMHPFIIGDRLQ